jgi:transketolase
VEIKNGHSFKSLINGFNTKVKKGKPTAYVINTIKSKGIKEFENDPVWHARKLKDKEINIGKKRLGIK